MGGNTNLPNLVPPKIMDFQNYGGEHTHIRFPMGGKSESWGEIQKGVPPQVGGKMSYYDVTHYNP